MWKLNEKWKKIWKKRLEPAPIAQLRDGLHLHKRDLQNGEPHDGQTYGAKANGGDFPRLGERRHAAVADARR